MQSNNEVHLSQPMMNTMEPTQKENEAMPNQGFLYKDRPRIQSVENNNDDTRQANLLSKCKQWKAAWYDFSQTTTLHGINKITEDTPYTMRR